MKYRMAPNSLFAILLRSPWWASLALALVFVAASRALLPPAYWLLGAMGALPFAGICLMVLWRQWRAPSARRVQATLDAVAAMGWGEFCVALEQAFARQGYAVQRTDGAADLAITRHGHTTLVAAKRWKAAKPGEQALHALHAQMQTRGASACMLVSLGQPSGNALHFAERAPVRLMGAGELAALLQGLPA